MPEASEPWWERNYEPRWSPPFGSESWWKAALGSGGRCGYCGADGTSDARLLAGFQLDHLVPQGTDDGINRVFACTICNQIKGTFDPSDGEGPPQTEEERTRLISKATEEIFARCKSAPATKYWRVLHLSVLAQKAKHVESLIRKTCAQELHLLDKAIGVVTDSLRRNAGKLCRRPETPAPEAVAALFAKGWKTIQAIKLLALKGYGQDAMGLLRSLTSLTI